MSEPKISAIICTHNRDSYLGAAIDSLLNQAECDEYEVLIVDNGSTDNTKAVVEERLSHPRLRYVFEPVLGLSVARNTGAKESRAPLLAYLDDDAIASPTWLSRLSAAFAQKEKLAIAGGKVTLLWGEGLTPPPWLSEGMSGCLGLYDLGDEVVSIVEPGLTPRGLNYCIRRDFLDRIGGFDPNLGRVGKKLLSNEELYMTEKALQLGWQVAYLPEAVVAHNVAPERICRRWFLQRGWWQGVSECYREQLSGSAGSKQLLRGGERILRGLYNSVKYVRDPARRFDNLVYAYGQIGYLSSALQGMLFSPQDAVGDRT
jgi:glycosyltransferase involved in cell wall biosynthesis